MTFNKLSFLLLFFPVCLVAKEPSLYELARTCTIGEQGSEAVSATSKDTENLMVFGIPQRVVSIDKSIFGFNSSYTMNRNKLGRFDTFHLMPFKKLFLANALRFPGGTVANFFDWTTMQIDVNAATQIKKKSMLETALWHKKLNRGNLVTADVKSFLSTAKDTNTKPFIVLNAYTGSTQQAIKAIDDIKAFRPAPVYWEIGNELSQFEYTVRLSKIKPWSVSTYSQRAKNISDYISKHYPRDKIGIVISDILSPKTLFDFARIHMIRQKYLDWDHGLSQLRNYEYVIVHPYIKTFGWNRWKNVNMGNSGLKLKRECIDYYNYVWILSSASQSPRIYSERVHERFAGKKIWITEYGLIDHTRGNEILISHSFLRTLFNLYYFIEWMRYTHEVDAFLYHLLGTGTGGHVTNNIDGSLNANGVSYYLLKDILHDTENISFPIISSQPNLSGIARFAQKNINPINGIYLYRKDRSDASKMLSVNFSLKPQNIKTIFGAANVKILKIPLAGRISLQPNGLNRHTQKINIKNGQFNQPALSIAIVSRAD